MSSSSLVMKMAVVGVLGFGGKRFFSEPQTTVFRAAGDLNTSGTRIRFEAKLSRRTVRVPN